MATPTLPYPNMDFTPLDVLTAAEMDQMVANDQYLRDFCAGLADGTNLSDGVIQARKIDFTTFPNVITSTTNSITIPAGKWLVFHSVQVNQGTASSAAVLIYRLTNAETTNHTWAVPPGSGQNEFTRLITLNVVNFTSNTTCTVTESTKINTVTGSE